LPDYQTIFSESPTTFTAQVTDRKNDHFTIVVHTYDDTRVSTVGFDMSSAQDGPSVGELYGILGPPTGVVISDFTSSRGSQKYDLAFSAEDCISAETLLVYGTYISMFHHVAGFYFGESGRCSAQDKQPPWLSWRGFKSFVAYFR
jgi:hypothetical protein